MLQHEPKTLIFIDPEVPDYQTLLQGAIPGAEVIILQGDADGVREITGVIRDRPNIGTVGVVSHGEPGCLHLGRSELNLDNIQEYAEELGRWRGRSHLFCSTVVM